MKFLSTRSPSNGGSPSLTFSQAALQGLAPDGGLYVPERFPSVSPESFAPLADDFPRFAAKMLAPFFEGDPLAESLPEISAAALNFPIPLKLLAREAAVLELFHGPTCAFKDVGARFLAECLARAPSASPESAARPTVICATSGDTGGAVAGAFYGRPGLDVLVLFPKGRISARQEKQLTCWGENVRAFATRGSFDDCQRLVKEALRDLQWAKRRRFLSANSISVGRLLPQSAFHARASIQHWLARGRAAGIVVPTGNLGDAVAALWAKRMGFPIARVCLATNSNATIRDFFASGELRPRASVATLANAMDVGDPSNMERLRSLYPRLEDLKRDVTCELATDHDISQAIREGEERWGEVWCPHTAAGIVALERLLAAGDAADRQRAWIVAATAHPAKFETVVEPLVGREVEPPPALRGLLDRAASVEEIEPTLAAFRAAVDGEAFS